MSASDATPLAVSMGEPAGVGPDIILQLFAQRAAIDLPPFIVYGHADFLRARAARFGLDVDIKPAGPAEAAEVFKTSLPVVDVEGLVPDHPGKASPVSGHVVIEAIRQAVHDTLAGACRGLVTAPINKAALYAAGFRHPGHTEFLASLCARDGVEQHPVMMLAHEGLRVVPMTIHVAISDVPKLITRGLLQQTVQIVHHDLRTRFGIEAPRIAVAGLNPHAGEGGSIGREDVEIIGPAVIGLAQDGIAVEGPFPADTLFYPPHWRAFDAVIAMYHDQALIPIKTVAFDSAVNLTMGLPIVRTSPDHGTAYDLAGTGKASTASFLAALRMADRMTRQ